MTGSGQTAEKPLVVQFVVPESEAAELASQIEAKGGQLSTSPKPWDIPAELLDDYTDAQFEPFLVISCTVAAGFLIKKISDVWLDHTRPGGHVLDTSGGSTTLRVAPYLERGTLVWQSDAGVQIFRPEQRDLALETLGHLAGVGLG